eukprot:15469632-Alexandrium_andersonii.AAC.1
MCSRHFRAVSEATLCVSCYAVEALGTLAKPVKGPTFHLDEAAFPAGLTGRNVVVQGLESAETGTPSVAALGA